VDKSTIIYVSVVAGCGLLLLVILRLLFDRAERRRREGVEELKRFVAIKTATTDPKETKKSREVALESIATRFSVIRRITIPVVLVIIGLLVGAPFFGRMPTTVVTLLGTAATIVLGIAAKPVLENVIAGIMVSFSQPIRIGDLVSIEGHYAVVEQIYLTYTVFKVWDFRRFVVPNSKLIQSEYVNYTLGDKWLWATVKFRVAYDADLDLLERLAREAVKDCPQSTEHAPGFWIIGMDNESVECWVAGWVGHPLDAWGLRHDLAKRLVKAFQEHGIRAHVHQVEARPPLAPPPERASDTAV
jgi:small-conductance mechanosensitive channel